MGKDSHLSYESKLGRLKVDAGLIFVSFVTTGIQLSEGHCCRPALNADILRPNIVDINYLPAREKALQQRLSLELPKQWLVSSDSEWPNVRVIPPGSHVI